MKIKNTVFFIGAFLSSLKLQANLPISIDDGKSVFMTRCAACHNVNMKLVGPALAGVDQRHKIEWIISFVHSSQTMVKNNDQYAVALFNEFNKTPMPDHPDISADQVRNIVEYIKSETKTKTAADEKPFTKPGRLEPKYLPISINNLEFFGIYTALIIILVATLVLAVKVKELQRDGKGRAD